MWQALIGPVTNLVGTFFKNKAAEKQAVHESKMRRIENDAEWDITQAKGSHSSFQED